MRCARPRDPLVPARRAATRVRGGDPRAAHAAAIRSRSPRPRPRRSSRGPDPGERAAAPRPSPPRPFARRDRPPHLLGRQPRAGPARRHASPRRDGDGHVHAARRPLRRRRARRRHRHAGTRGPARVDAHADRRRRDACASAGRRPTPLATAPIGDARARHCPRRNLQRMDAFLAIVSKREVREYDGRPLPEDAVRRILEAGRLAGSSRNRQQRRFVVLQRPRRGRRGRLQRRRTCSAPRSSSRSSPPARARSALDAGRAAQNMMLAAHNEGIGSCPNGARRRRRDGRRRRRRGGRAGRDDPLLRLPGHARATRSAAAPRSGSSAPTASRSTTSSQSAEAISCATWPAAASGTAAKLISRRRARARRGAGRDAVERRRRARGRRRRARPRRRPGCGRRRAGRPRRRCTVASGQRVARAPRSARRGGGGRRGRCGAGGGRRRRGSMKSASASCSSAGRPWSSALARREQRARARPAGAISQPSRSAGASVLETEPTWATRSGRSPCSAPTGARS